MALPITDAALSTSLEVSKTTNIVLEIDGVDTLYGAVSIDKILEYGDDISYGDPGIFYGGSIPIEGQESLISFTGGTSTTIKQTLQVDKGKGESISSMVIALVDKLGKITELITPGEVVDEILGRKAKVHLGLIGTNFPDDYITIFRGNISDVASGSGKILLTIEHPDKKKKSKLFPKTNTELSAAITAGSTVIPVNDTSEFLSPYTFTDGSIDESIKYYLRIDDEIIRYETTTASQFQTITRGEFNTIAASHADEANVESYIELTGNAIDLALKLMLSGRADPYIDDLAATNFVRISATETVNNSIFFNDLDLVSKYNVQRGDFVTTTGATNGANNVSNKTVNDIVVTDDGSYIILDDVAFIEENGTAATIDFTSKYATLGAGLQMLPDEIDILEHESVKDKFLNSFDYQFLIKDEIDGKTFLSEEIYNPASAFSLPRKAQSSVGFHSPPLPTDVIKILNSSNILNADSLKIKRSISKNFFNSIAYAFDESFLEEDRFTRGKVVVSGSSGTRIPVGSKPLTIKSKGMRESLSASIIAEASGSRRIKKYQFGAESIPGVKLNFETGFTIESGDIILLDMSSLQISDITTGDRAGESRLFQVENRVFDLKTGNITLDIVDTNFDKDARFGLISPASFVKDGTSETSFIIEPSFTKPFGDNEFRKWQDYVNAFIRVRSLDFSTIGTAKLLGFAGNTVQLDAGLGFTPTAGMVMEFAKYDDVQSDVVQNIFVSLSDDENDFNDGKPFYGLV